VVILIAIAEAVIDLLGSPEKRKKMGAAARESALEKFAPEAAARKLTGIYKQVVSAK
jgi:glycosyltransferase involved in cell wall biosynthesis